MVLGPSSLLTTRFAEELSPRPYKAASKAALLTARRAFDRATSFERLVAVEIHQGERHPVRDWHPQVRLTPANGLHDLGRLSPSWADSVEQVRQ